MHVITAANQPFPSASVLIHIAPKAVVAALGAAQSGHRPPVVDNVIAITRRSWTSPGDTFGDFAA